MYIFLSRISSLKRMVFNMKTVLFKSLRGSFRLLAFFLVAGVVFFSLNGYLSAATRIVKKCEECGKIIPSNASYLKSKTSNKIFCSEECFKKNMEQQMPVCCVCGKKYSEGYVSDGKHYCSQKCLETTFHVCMHCKKPKPAGFMLNEDTFLCVECNALPKCAVCTLPLDNKSLLLDDGRRVCSACASDGIYDQKKAVSYFTDMRSEICNMFQFATSHTINFSLCSRSDIEAELGKNSERERGLFIHKTEETKLGRFTLKTKHLYRICILSGLEPKAFRAVAAHELTHDWMSQELPHIEDPLIREGFSEYVSWRYCIHKKYTKQQAEIEQNIDEVYGKGFLQVRKMLEKQPDNATSWKKELLKQYPVP